MKEKIIFILIIFGYVVFFMVFIVIDYFFGLIFFVVKYGIMDLENWDFQKDGNVQLNGKWILYFNQLLLLKEIVLVKGKDFFFVDVFSNVKLVKQGINVEYGMYKLMIRLK